MEKTPYPPKAENDLNMQKQAESAVFENQAGNVAQEDAQNVEPKVQTPPVMQQTPLKDAQAAHMSKGVPNYAHTNYAHTNYVHPNMPPPQMTPNMPYGGAPNMPNMGYMLPHPYPAMGPQQPPKKKRSTAFTVFMIVVAVLVVGAILLATIFGIMTVSMFSPSEYNVNTPGNTFSVIHVKGTVQTIESSVLGLSSTTYYHDDTLDYVEELIENESNKGILLYMNTPGGGVTEGDELYMALMEYKEKTGRPVWGYMDDVCASAGYNIISAADHIVANRNTTTGSIGVYIAITDTSGLYDKLGVRTALIKSGENKGVGVSGVPITAEQEAVYQGVVDELYERFVNVVAKSRGMSYSEAKELSDGRIYTASQALENGLVDEVSDWDKVLVDFEELTGATEFNPNFSRQTVVSQFFGELVEYLPKSDAQSILQSMEQFPSGVPISYYDPSLTEVQ